MVAGRHHDAANGRTPAHVPLVPGATDLLVLVLDVAGLADGRAAVDVNDADAAGRKADLGVLALFRDELRRTARGAHELRSAARLELDPVDLRSGRHVLERQAVADARLGVRPRDDRVADPQVLRRDDVALLAVLIEEEREARRAVGVVFDRLHRGGNAVLVALEVDHPVVALLTAAAMARCDAALRVAPGVAELPLGEASLGLLALRQLLKRSGLAEAPHRRRGLVLLQRHFPKPLPRSTSRCAGPR